MATATVPTEDDFRIALRFSNYFHIDRPQSELEFVDILVDTDIRLYIDPYALSVEEDDWSKECNNLVVGYFQSLVDALKAGDTRRAMEVLGNLHEPNETRLGQSRGKPRGRGIGSMQAKSLFGAFEKSKAVQTGLLADLSDCELFIDGIGHDKISDITTNIIRGKLVEFTKEQCLRWDVPTEDRPTGPWWDAIRKDWRSGYDQLPVYKSRPLILVPKRNVRYKMAIDDREFYDFEVVEFIRDHYNHAEILNPSSSLFKLLKQGLKVTKKEVGEHFPKTKDLLREFAEKFPEVFEKYKKTAKEEAELGKGKPSDGEIFELEMRTAHEQGQILKEERHLHMTIYNVGGDNFGAMGEGNRVFLKDVSIYKRDVDAAQTIEVETRELLKRAIDEIEASEAEDADKADAKENLQKLTDELAGEKKPGLVARHLKRLAQVLPAVAKILESSKEIGGVLSQLPNPFGG